MIRPQLGRVLRIASLYRTRTTRSISSLYLSTTTKRSFHCSTAFNAAPKPKSSPPNVKSAVINAKLTPESIVDKIYGMTLTKKAQTLRMRPPVVTIMGHVDHGKTTLLDSIRKSELVKNEHGGITQHIGAFVVSLDETSKGSNTKNLKDLVVFLDTPGHKAFSAMRERGSSMTDIVVLVVAADDGVMEQTIESINFARKANVPIIVAINKIDKIKNDPDKIEYLKAGLKTQGITLEEDGGDIQSVRMSALKSDGIQELKETILALSETLELKAHSDGFAECAVIESSVHPHRGRLATLLVQKGTLKRGDILVTANPFQGNVSWAKVRSMFNEYGQVMTEATASVPVQVIGWRDDTLPSAGDLVWQLGSEKQVKDVLTLGKQFQRQQQEAVDSEAIRSKQDEHNKLYKPELNARREAGIRYKRKKLTGPREKVILTEGDELKTSVVLKADVNGSLEVLLDIFDSYPNDRYEAKLNLVHYGLGDVNEGDIELASCFPNGAIYTFNTGVFQPALIKMAKELDVPIRKFNVIYHLVDELKETIQQRMPMVEKENIVGEAVVQQEFVVNEKRKKIPVAGCRCTKGAIRKNDVRYKLVRNGQVIRAGLSLSSMRHHRDEVDTIKKDYECGLRFANNFIDDESQDQTIRFAPQDVLVCYEISRIRQPLVWKPKGF